MINIAITGLSHPKNVWSVVLETEEKKNHNSVSKQAKSATKIVTFSIDFWKI